MGTYRSKGIKNDVEKLPIMLEEVDYEVKTKIKCNKKISPIREIFRLNEIRIDISS